MHCRSLESPQTSRNHYKIHAFGTQFSASSKKQSFFSQSLYKNSTASCSELLKENQILKHEVCAIRETLVRILVAQGWREQSASLVETPQLLEELIMLILTRSEEMSQLKHQISTCIHDSQRSSDSSSRRQTRRTSGNFSIYSRESQNFSNQNCNTEDCHEQIKEIPMHRVLNISKYEPMALLSIGKQVKTINRLSSNELLLKKESRKSSCNSSIIESSLRQLLNLKSKNRLSIDKSIYISQDAEPTERYHSSKQRLEDHLTLTIHGLAHGGQQLSPIKEERVSKYSQMDTSKINFNKAERFTFESTTSEPESYVNRSQLSP